ncbi:hypothetical protein [Xanthomonas maliensis]|uniref:hypothetical protein n=1 Tax=Xanthomonas maliensis TaxID=1321368 RepID=UPI00126589AE|nr:hypothetical protein [Xanthomonas maliensis]
MSLVDVTVRRRLRLSNDGLPEAPASRLLMSKAAQHRFVPGRFRSHSGGVRFGHIGPDVERLFKM